MPEKMAWAVPPPVFLHITGESFRAFLKFAESGATVRITTYCGRRYLLIHRDGMDADAIRRSMAKYSTQGLIYCSPEKLPEDLRKRHILPLARGKISLQSGGNYLHVFQKVEN